MCCPVGEVLEPRYRALDLEPLASEDCYIAILELTSTVKEDQRLYHVIVENDRGSDRRALMLRVDEPGQVKHSRARRARNELLAHRSLRSMERVAVDAWR